MLGKDEADYKERAIYYHTRLLVILRGLNSAELESLYSTSLPMFFARLDKTKKRKLKRIFEETYNGHEAHFKRIGQGYLCGGYWWCHVYLPARGTPGLNAESHVTMHESRNHMDSRAAVHNHGQRRGDGGERPFRKNWPLPKFGSEIPKRETAA